MENEIVITCLSCGTVKAISHVQENTLTDAEVIAQAGHIPACASKSHVAVQQEQREGEPHVAFYAVCEVV